MQKHFLKFIKGFTNFACYPFILISHNSQLAAKYLPNQVEPSITSLEINNIKHGLFHGFDIKQKKDFFIAENKKDTNK